MGKFTATQNNFSSGELSPTLEGRTDLQEYANGASEILNMIPLKDGGAARRTGTMNPVSFFSTSVNYGQLFPILDELDYRMIMIRKSTSGMGLDAATLTQTLVGNSIQDLDVAVTPVSTSLTTRFIELVTLFDASLDFRKFNYIQVFDFLIMTHPTGVLPPLIVYKSGSGLAIEEYLVYAASNEAPEGRALTWRDYDANNTITATVNAGSTNITFSVAITDISKRHGDYIRIEDSGEAIFKVTGSASSFILNVTLVAGIVATGVAITDWVWNEWSFEYGFPRSCSLFQQRVCFGGTQNKPATVWFGNIENLFLLLNKKLTQDSVSDNSGLDFFGADIASDPFTVTMASNTTTSITWMNSDRVLQVGTLSAEYVISTVDGLFDRDHAEVGAQTFYGSRGVNAVRAQNEVVYVMRNGKELRSNRFSFENGGQTSRLLSVLSKEMVYHNLDESTDSRYLASIVSLAYQPSRSCMWALTSEGELIGTVLEESSATLAWHRHTISGTDVEILGMTSIPSPDNNSDLVFLSIKRTISGVDEFYIELIQDDFGYEKLAGGVELPFYLDSSRRAIPTGTTLTGLNLVGSLVGETVTVLADGKDLGDFLVPASGIIDTQYTLQIDSQMVYGLRYKSRIRSMLIKSGSRTGDPQIQKSRIESLAVNVDKSKHFKIGTKESNVEDVFLVDKDSEDTFTGIEHRSVASSGGREQRFIIETESPFPLTVLSVGVRGEAQD